MLHTPGLTLARSSAGKILPPPLPKAVDKDSSRCKIHYYKDIIVNQFLHLKIQNDMTLKKSLTEDKWLSIFICNIKILKCGNIFHLREYYFRLRNQKIHHRAKVFISKYLKTEFQTTELLFIKMHGLYTVPFTKEGNLHACGNVCEYLCLVMCGGLHACTCIRQPEDNSDFILWNVVCFFRNRVSHWPKTHQLRFIGWPVSPRDLLWEGERVGDQI